MENETKYVSESEKNSEDAKCYGTLPIKVLLSEKPKGPYWLIPLIWGINKHFFSFGTDSYSNYLFFSQQLESNIFYYIQRNLIVIGNHWQLKFYRHRYRFTTYILPFISYSGNYEGFCIIGWGARHTMCLLAFFILFINYSLRVNISIAIVSMVKSGYKVLFTYPLLI